MGGNDEVFSDDKGSLVFNFMEDESYLRGPSKDEVAKAKRDKAKRQTELGYDELTYDGQQEMADQMFAEMRERNNGLARKLMSVKDLSKIPPPRPLLDGLLYHHTLAQLAAESGSYKSFLTVAWACHVATGKDLGEHRVRERQKVVYIAAEGAESLQVRILAWCERNKVDPRELDGWLEILPEPIQLGNKESVTETRQMVHALRPALVIMDTRAKVTVGMDENSSTEQGKAIDVAGSIIRESGCTVLVVHHTGRAGAAGRGSSAWDGGVWSDLRAAARRGELIAAVRCEKHKGAKSGCTHTFQMRKHYVTSDLLNVDGMDEVEQEQARWTLVADVTEQTTQAPEVSHEQRVLDALSTSIAIDDGHTVSELVTITGISKSTLYRVLSGLKDAELIEKDGARYVKRGD